MRRRSNLLRSTSATEVDSNMSSYPKRERVPGKDHIDPASLTVETRDVAQEPLQTIPQQLQAGQSAARANHLFNLRNELNDSIAAVKVATPNRDINQPGRARYERNFQRMLQAIRQFTLAGGGAVSAPTYLPPPPRTDWETTYSAESFPADPPADDSHIRARKEKEKAANIRPGTPGTAAEQAWLNVQGVK